MGRLETLKMFVRAIVDRRILQAKKEGKEYIPPKPKTWADEMVEESIKASKPLKTAKEDDFVVLDRIRKAAKSGDRYAQEFYREYRR